MPFLFIVLSAWHCGEKNNRDWPLFKAVFGVNACDSAEANVPKPTWRGNSNVRLAQLSQTSRAHAMHTDSRETHATHSGIEWATGSNVTYEERLRRANEWL